MKNRGIKNQPAMRITNKEAAHFSAPGTRPRSNHLPRKGLLSSGFRRVKKLMVCRHNYRAQTYTDFAIPRDDHVIQAIETAMFSAQSRVPGENFGTLTGVSQIMPSARMLLHIRGFNGRYPSPSVGYPGPTKRIRVWVPAGGSEMAYLPSGFLCSHS